MNLIHRILPKDYLDNPKSQISFHKRMMKFWVRSAGFMNLVYFYSIYLGLTGHVGEALIIAGFINYVTNQISFYANWSTDFGALSAAQASAKADTVSNQVDEHDDKFDDLSDALQGTQIIAEF
jgi:hypothetical protein